MSRRRSEVVWWRVTKGESTKEAAAGEGVGSSRLLRVSMCFLWRCIASLFHVKKPLTVWSREHISEPVELHGAGQEDQRLSSLVGSVEPPSLG